MSESTLWKTSFFRNLRRILPVQQYYPLRETILKEVVSSKGNPTGTMSTGTMSTGTICSGTSDSGLPQMRTQCINLSTKDKTWRSKIIPMYSYTIRTFWTSQRGQLPYKEQLYLSKVSFIQRFHWIYIPYEGPCSWQTTTSLRRPIFLMTNVRMRGPLPVTTTFERPPFTDGWGWSPTWGLQYCTFASTTKANLISGTVFHVSGLFKEVPLS
jgi:hypothetical protein